MNDKQLNFVQQILSFIEKNKNAIQHGSIETRLIFRDGYPVRLETSVNQSFQDVQARKQ